jgi:hypothetical protein
MNRTMWDLLTHCCYDDYFMVSDIIFSYLCTPKKVIFVPGFGSEHRTTCDCEGKDSVLGFKVRLSIQIGYSLQPSYQVMLCILVRVYTRL